MSDEEKNAANIDSEVKNESVKPPADKGDEVLIEKVREIELAKNEQAKKMEVVRLERENTAKILGEKSHFTPVMTDDEAKKEMFRRSRRTFLIGGAAAVFGYLGYGWLREKGETPFRGAFEFNEKLSQIYYSPKNLAPEFSRNRVGELRVNGGEGLSDGFDSETWRLQVLGVANQEKYPQYVADIAYETAMDNSSEMRDTGKQHEQVDAKQKPGAGEMPPETVDRAAASQMPMPGLLLTLNDIKNLPRVEMTTELKCIEGWSVVVNWAGARFADFIRQFLPTTKNGASPDINRPQDFLPYVSLVTPDGGYYVGMDMPSILHPQTLLCYEMNGAPLTVEHGAPLRLVTPTKYGIKQIKRIGRIAFTNERPADFWAERGYDWYAGH